MPSKNRLIKQGIKYTDSLFDEISKRLEKGVKASDTLEAFLEKTAGYTSGNPLVESGYYDKMMKLILQETNNHKFSRPAQKELVRLTIENRVGELITDVGEDIRDNVRDIVRDGYNSNLSQDEIATNISNKVSAIKGKRAKAIARTEIARTATISDYIINKERGATHFYVECRNTACPICKEAWHKHWSKANDESFTPKDSSAGGKGWIGDRTYSMKDTAMLPPIHPNCRCVPYFISEDDVTGEVEPVIGRRPTTTTTTTETVEEPTPTVENPIPSEVHSKMDKFGKQYEYSTKEHLQFFTMTDSSDIASGMEGNVNLTGKQRQYLNEKAETKEEVHSLHNHPTNEHRKEGYTMFSDEDVKTFVSENIRGSTNDVPINMKTSSAENQYNRITIERLDNFYEVYEKGIKFEESLGRGTSYAISRAFLHQEQFYEKYHPTVSKGMQYMRDVKSKLREQGLTGYEISKEVEKYQAKADKIDEKVFEERQKEFPKLIDAMNKELNPYGLHITCEYKLGIYANSKTNVKTSNEPTPNEQKKEVSQEDLEQLEFLKEQYDMAKQDLKRLSKTDPQYKAIQRMAINTRKRIKQLEKKLS